MTQPAKVQEPSMEEILASIRRIIADDEAKPAGCRETGQSGGRQAGSSGQTGGDEGYSAFGDCARARSRPLPSPRRRLLRRRSRRQQQSGRHRRDARQPRCGNARGRHQAGTARRRRVRTHRRDGIAGSGRRRQLVQQGRAADDIEFTERTSAKARQPAYEPPPFESASRRRNRSCRARPSRPSSPPSIRWPIPCSATTRGRWKIWSRKCCGRC